LCFKVKNFAGKARNVPAFVDEQSLAAKRF
jgi:hypothetical protein